MKAAPTSPGSGKRIILPPWLESEREQVEARLTPLPDPRADWPTTLLANLAAEAQR